MHALSFGANSQKAGVQAYLDLAREAYKEARDEMSLHVQKLNGMYMPAAPASPAHGFLGAE